MTQQQSLIKLEAQIDQLTESTMRRELGQLSNEPIPNFKNNLPTYQPLGPSHQSNIPPKNPQFKNDKIIFELKSDRILKDPYQVQVSEASIDASQKENLEEEISTETSPIEEPEPSTDIDLNDTKKKADELPEIYPSKVLFFSALEVSSSSLESPSPPKLKSSSVTLENTCLESNDTLLASRASNSTSNLKI